VDHDDGGDDDADVVTLRGALPPESPPGVCPLNPHWGLRPQTPVIGSRSRARYVCIIKNPYNRPYADNDNAFVT